MQVSVEALRRVTSALFDRLEAAGHHSIQFPHDYYWDVVRAQRHNLESEPHNLIVGQLSDDLWNLEEMLRDDCLCAAYGLTRLGSVLREIGELVVD